MQDQQQQQQQQQQRVIHHSVARGIEESKQRHSERVAIYSNYGYVINRVSVQFMVDYLLQGDSTGGQNVTELTLNSVHLPSPSDGGLDALCALFTNTTRLASVDFWGCDFGGEDGGRQVLESFHNNRSITDLTITYEFCNNNIANNMENAEFCESLSQLLRNNPTLVSLALVRCNFVGVESVRALLPGIQSLTVLRLRECRIGNGGLGLIAASLVGNTSMLVLDISHNKITVDGVAHISTLLRSTRLQEIDLEGNDVCANAPSLQRLHDDLVHNPYLVRLNVNVPQPYRPRRFPLPPRERRPEHVAILNLLDQNRDMPSARQTSADQAEALLASQDETHDETLINNNNNSIWFKAIVRLAARRCNSGASGIFHIFNTRPKLLCPAPIAIATNQEGQQLLSDMAACQKMEPRISRLGQLAWQNEIRAGLCRYLSSAGTDREAFTGAINRLAEYEQRMEENAVEEPQQMDHRHEEEAQQDPSQPDAAATHQRPEEDDIDIKNHDDDSSSSYNGKRQRLS